MTLQQKLSGLYSNQDHKASPVVPLVLKHPHQDTSRRENSWRIFITTERLIGVFVVINQSAVKEISRRCPKRYHH